MSILPCIETFTAVVESGSFTAAADVLGMSRPVVSKQVSLLEQHLGVQLLNRTTRRLHLTQAGEVFASYSHRIMSDIREAEQSVLPLQSEPQGRFGKGVHVIFNHSSQFAVDPGGVRDDEHDSELVIGQKHSLVEITN